MGMDVVPPNPQCLSIMAHIRLANGITEMDLGARG